jgi:hypothetical protein
VASSVAVATPVRTQAFANARNDDSSAAMASLI